MRVDEDSREILAFGSGTAGSGSTAAASASRSLRSASIRMRRCSPIICSLEGEAETLIKMYYYNILNMLFRWVNRSLSRIVFIMIVPRRGLTYLID